MILRLFLLSAIPLIAITLFAPNSYASKDKESVFTRFEKPMPELELLSDTEFRKITRPVKKKPYGQDVLEYSMRIPKSWVEREDKSSSNFLLSQSLFLDLNVFYGKPTPYGRSRIEVEALNLDSVLTVKQWYLKHIIEGGYTIEGFVAHDNNRVESLSVFADGDISYYVRTLITLNGDKIIMVKYFVPTQFIKEQAFMQEQVLNSFTLLNSIERPPIEMSLYRFLDIAELKYPSSWKVFSKPFRQIERMEVSVLNIREIPKARGRKVSSFTDAKLDVSVVAASTKQTLIDEIGKYKQKIEASGMLVGDKLETKDDFVYDKLLDFAITEVYESVDSTNNLSEYELWFTASVGGNYYYLFTLLTPSRNERFGVWAENTQNYKEILRNFKPASGAFLQRDY